MGIYIKSIEKPKCCAGCFCEVDGTDYCMGYTCQLTKERTDYTRHISVLDSCLMVEVSDNHGRLVDVDVLKKHGLFYTNLSGSSEYAIPVYALKEAKTIIPSTEPEPEPHGYY